VFSEAAIPVYVAKEITKGLSAMNSAEVTPAALKCWIAERAKDGDIDIGVRYCMHYQDVARFHAIAPGGRESKWLLLAALLKLARRICWVSSAEDLMGGRHQQLTSLSQTLMRAYRKGDSGVQTKESRELARAFATN
jgi:hypothetical protein